MPSMRFALLLAACVSLMGCGAEFDKKAAADCVGGAIAKQNIKTGALGSIIGNKNFAPTIKARDLQVGACEKRAPGQHLCLVEYRIEFIGGDEAVMGLLQLGGVLSGTDINAMQQTYWLFTEGPQTYSCQLTD